MRSQSIRPSQFVTTFGPGSILEGPDGPRIVLSLEKSGVFGASPPSQYVIFESNLTAMLAEHGNPVPVRLPTNAEKQVRDTDPIYHTAPFPKWSLCVQHANLYYHKFPDLSTGCPGCNPERDKWSALRKSRKEAIRFVSACEAGHLDDVDWFMVVSHATPSCRGGSYRWEGGGGALRNINIVCTACGGSGNLGTAYSRDWPCRGNWPEHQSRDQGCGRPARILQRGAANLYTTELVTAVTVPRLDTRLHQALGSIAIFGILQVLKHMDQLTGADIRKHIEMRSQAGGISPVIYSEVRLYDDSYLERVATEVLQMVVPANSEQARLDEFRELQTAATNGHPLEPSKTPGAPPLFEVIGSDVRRGVCTTSSSFTLRVTPVSRLRVVMAQLGYRRTLSGTPGELVPSTFTTGQDKWIPGVELHGEGIFIDLVPLPGEEAARAHPPLTSQDAQMWLAEYQDKGNDKNHPVFVWWHTLSHRLVRALGIDSGYSSAAVRERIYVRIDSQSGVATGGILLYTAQPGGDGTLGGLIALVPTFERVLRAALRDIDACSNDPLCVDEHFGPGRANGAACYACEFISETSCEFRNLHLDRNVLLLQLP